MNIGFGSLKQMSDPLRYNREILPKGKKLRDLYKEELKRQHRSGDGADVAMVRTRVVEILRQDKRTRSIERVIRLAIIFSVAVVILWIVIEITKVNHVETPTHSSKRNYETTFPLSDILVLKTVYYNNGMKATETIFEGPYQHLNSQSFYETGERFRTATYYHDTLLTEVFFFKSGDTIRNFPNVRPERLQQIRILDPGTKKTITFKMQHGRIVDDSYYEEDR